MIIHFKTTGCEGGTMACQFEIPESDSRQQLSGTSKRPLEHLAAELSDILLGGNCGPLLASCFEIVIFRAILREVVFSKRGAATATFMKLRLFIFEGRVSGPASGCIRLNLGPVYRFAPGCQTGSTRPLRTK